MDYDTKELHASLQAADLRQKFIAWLQTDADRLIAASELLGGELWHDRAVGVTDAIASGAAPEAVDAELNDLRRLLTLELTDDIASVEACCFLAVHPDDPRADDARLCAEALELGFEALNIYASLDVKEVA